MQNTNNEQNLLNSANKETSKSQTLQKTVLAPTAKDKSVDFFKTTKVESCTHVIMKNGTPYAAPFKENKRKEYSDYVTPSSEIFSLSQ